MNELLPTGQFEIVSLNLSEKTGTRKKPVKVLELVAGLGVLGDAHAGVTEDRQVSLLSMEEIEGASARLKYSSCTKAAGLESLNPGDFAENITTRGVDLHLLPLGTKLRIGQVILEVSKIGKECHAECEIRRLVGDCVMPRKGIFARVVKGGEVRCEDSGHYSF